MVIVDNRAIGVFDSGLGGLTAVREIRRLLPNENIIYFGDTGRVPYGTRSSDTIISYTKQDINFLKTHNIKAIVVACGTASSVAVPFVKNEYKTEIFDVLEPTVNSAINFKKNQKIGIIATSSTINSRSYETKIHEISKKNNLEIETFAVACPLFVPLVENGRISEDDCVTNLVIEEYLSVLKEKNIDTLILGCTHYPLISKNISNFLGENVRLIDAGKEVSKNLSKNIQFCDKREGKTEYYVTDDVKSFGRNAKIFLGEEIVEKTTLIDITKY